MSDPRQTDPRLSDPVLRREDRSGGVWGWIAGIAVLALIAFVVIAGWNGSQNTANNSSPPPATTGQTTPGATPPSTTGSGTTSPQPMSPPANRQ
jgi:multidrug efflux pump subunit AcrA (membrane-fusion protein)